MSGTSRQASQGARSSARLKAPNIPPSDPETPDHSPRSSAPTPLPHSPSAARNLLYSHKFLDNKNDAISGSRIQHILARIARSSDMPPHLASFVEAINLLLPEILDPYAKLSAETVAISSKLDDLSKHMSSLGELEVKLAPFCESLAKAVDKTEQAESAAIETQRMMTQLVDSLEESRPAAPPLPAAAAQDPYLSTDDFPGMHPDRLARLSHAAPSFAEVAARAPRPPPHSSAQHTYSDKTIAATKKVLVQPHEGAALDNLTKMSARELVTKAELAAQAAQTHLRGTDFVDAPGRANMPELEFRTAVHLPRGGIEYTMGSAEQAAWLSIGPVAEAFANGFGDQVTVKGQHVWALLERVPITFKPEDPSALRSLERDNGLDQGDILSAYWFKPLERRAVNQVKANLKVEFRSMDVADRLIQSGARVEFAPVQVRRIEEDPMRCLKCQRFGHIAIKCKQDADTCSQCGGQHRSNVCAQREKSFCVSCQTDSHCSWDRKCPAFIDARDRLNECKPDNRRRFFNPLNAQLHTEPARKPRGPTARTLGDIPVTWAGSRRSQSMRQTTLHDFPSERRPDPYDTSDLPLTTWGSEPPATTSWDSPSRQASPTFPLTSRSRASSISSSSSSVTTKGFTLRPVSR